jgi:hypothetical protein
MLATDLMGDTSLVGDGLEAVLIITDQHLSPHQVQQRLQPGMEGVGLFVAQNLNVQHDSCVGINHHRYRHRLTPATQIGQIGSRH